MRGNAGQAGGRDMLVPLGERLVAAEIHAGLLHALSRRLEASGGESERDLLDRLLRQELRHTQLLERAIRGLGGSPAARPPGARRQSAARVGFQRITQDSDASFTEALDAVLVAERGDRAAWEHLVELAERLCLSALAWEFRGILLEEREQERALTEMKGRLASA